MASTLPRHSLLNGTKPEHYLSKFVKPYRAFFSLLKEKLLRKSSPMKQAAFSTKERISMFQEQGKTEEQYLSEQKFSAEEIARVLKLRDHYQHGGSDRAAVIRHLSFLKYLLSQDQISS